MSDEPLRYGVVGCSSMGRTHADAVAATPGADLVACADVSEHAAREFAAARGCDAYDGGAAMFDAADLDAVSVCTPNGTHTDVVVDAADAGVAVLCEKPLDVTPERVDRLVGACRDAGVALGGVFQRRTLPEMRFFRETVREGIGRPLLAEAELKWHRGPSYYEGWHGSADLDGGVLFTQALHVVDLLRWAVGDVARVSASFDTLHHDVEVPDTAVVALEFENGARGQVSATTATRPSHPIRLDANGTGGSVSVHEGGVDAYDTGDEREEAVDLDPAEADGHTLQVRDFVAAVREGREPMVPPAEARAAVDVVFAAEESVRRGEWVRVDAVGGSAE